MTVFNKHHGNVPAGAINIMRGTKWGNPFPINKDHDRSLVLEMYEKYLGVQVQDGRITADDLANLHNQDLVCCCKPAACHGDILERYAEKAHKLLVRKPEFKLIVFGGRNFFDKDRLITEIVKLAEGELDDYMVSIVSGMAKGADRLAWNFAIAYNLRRYPFEANWDDINVPGAIVKHNERGPYNALAGHMRNQEMAEFANGGLGFWDGKSTGTADMGKRLERMKKFVRVVRY